MYGTPFGRLANKSCCDNTLPPFVGRKWAPKFSGQFRIIEVISPQVLQIQTINDSSFEDIVHASYLRPVINRVPATEDVVSPNPDVSDETLLDDSPFKDDASESPVLSPPQTPPPATSTPIPPSTFSTPNAFVSADDSLSSLASASPTIPESSALAIAEPPPQSLSPSASPSSSTPLRRLSSIATRVKTTVRAAAALARDANIRVLAKRQYKKRPKPP